MISGSPLYVPDDPRDQALLRLMEDGLPLVTRPYAELACQVGYSEEEVIGRIGFWQSLGLIKRLGVIVRHRPLGYRANAMVVWDVPDAEVSRIGHQMSQLTGVTLCYRRPRRLPDWPYNLFCMIHGKDRTQVEAQIEAVSETCGLSQVARAILFSLRCFKQRGARYRVANRASLPILDTSPTD